MSRASIQTSGFFLLFATSQLDAQLTSTVVGSGVSADDRSAQYRLGYIPENEAIAHRFHYQHSLSDAWRLRGIVAWEGDEDTQIGFDYFRLEAQWQFQETDEHGWASAFRFELQIPEDRDDPFRGRIGWFTQWAVDEDWQFRTNVLVGRAFGPNNADGFSPELRLQVTRRVTNALRLGVDYFGDFNSTEDFGTFDEQEHELGPVLKIKFGKNWKGLATTLFGISEGAPDTDIMLSLDRSF